jgi:hypothetical protein
VDQNAHSTEYILVDNNIDANIDAHIDAALPLLTALLCSPSSSLISSWHFFKTLRF